jgi:hypothetical protein
MVPSATAQTAVRQTLSSSEFPATIIAATGIQNTISASRALKGCPAIYSLLGWTFVELTGIDGWLIPKA